VSKILWIKFGWSNFYRGGLVDGNFPFTQLGAQGHEAWNFLPQDDGSYYCYTPPQGGSGTPRNNEPFGWTVVCLAKNPNQKGIHIVGWYENATLNGGYAVRPAGFHPIGLAPLDDYLYTIHSNSAWFVPHDFRSEPFSHPSVGQGKYSFLDGPNVKITENKREVRLILWDQIKRLKSVAIHNPTAENAPDRDNDKVDPLSGFGGGPEHRKVVEEAAVDAATHTLIQRGYDVISREKDHIGYDLHATHSGDGPTLHVEVKGTSQSEPRFFMTVNEYNYREANEWRLAMVVDALTNPSVTLLTLSDVQRKFDLNPMVWKATPKASTEVTKSE
jgi:hypothetical protein